MGPNAHLPLLGNSGKPVTLKTSSLTKFLRYVFQGCEQAIFRDLGPAKPRGRKHAIFENLEPAKSLSREHARAWNLESAKSRISEDG
jgi:hypothetical protein